MTFSLDIRPCASDDSALLCRYEGAEGLVLQIQSNRTNPLVSPFGNEALRYAAGIDAEFPLIVADADGAAQALDEALRLKQANIAFGVLPRLADGPSLTARAVARWCVEQNQDADEARKLYESLGQGQLHFNGSPVTQSTHYAPEAVETLRTCARLADAVFVRSHAERRVLERLFGRDLQVRVIAARPDLSVPECAPAIDSDRVVVWAPNLAAEDLYGYIYALDDFKRPSIFVCNEFLERTSHEFLRPEHAAAALRQASVIVTTDLIDPGTAMAFAGRNYGVVSPLTSGAQEYLLDSFGYNPLNFYSLIEAISRARGERRARLRPAAQSMRPGDFTLPELPSSSTQELPLISVIISAREDITVIDDALRRLQTQKYPRIETIITGAAEDTRRRVQERYPQARFAVASEHESELTSGIRAARGDWMCNLDAWTEYFPDHLTRLYDGARNSGLHVVHADLGIIHRAAASNEVRSAAVLHERAFDAFAARFNELFELRGCLVSREAARSVASDINEAGDDALHVFLERLAARFDFAYIDAVTATLSSKVLAGRRSAAIAATERRFSRVALGDDAFVIDRRHQTLEAMRHGESHADHLLARIGG